MKLSDDILGCELGINQLFFVTLKMYLYNYK